VLCAVIHSAFSLIVERFIYLPRDILLRVFFLVIFTRVTFCSLGSVSIYDVRTGASAGSSSMQLRVASERIGAIAFVNVGGGSDAVIAASDDGCITMFDTRRPDLPLSIVEARRSRQPLVFVL
jgi:hypothetical protein